MIRTFIADGRIRGFDLDISIVNVPTAGEPTFPPLVLHFDADGTTRWVETTEGQAVEPTFRLDVHMARSLLDALTLQFDGAEDTRALRRDYNAERARVNSLTAALIQVTECLASRQGAAAPAIGDRPGVPDQWCVKCHLAWGVRTEDGSTEWFEFWQAPRECHHEFAHPSGPSGEDSRN